MVHENHPLFGDPAIDPSPKSCVQPADTNMRICGLSPLQPVLVYREVRGRSRLRWRRASGRYRDASGPTVLAVQLLCQHYSIIVECQSRTSLTAACCLRYLPIVHFHRMVKVWRLPVTCRFTLIQPWKRNQHKTKR